MADINKKVVKAEDLRITKLRTYLFNIIDTLLTEKKYQINANMLSDKINNYSLNNNSFNYFYKHHSNKIKYIYQSKSLS